MRFRLFVLAVVLWLGFLSISLPAPSSPTARKRLPASFSPPPDPFPAPPSGGLATAGCTLALDGFPPRPRVGCSLPF